MMIDAHIHLDHYHPLQQKAILDDLSKHQVDALISVSFNLESCLKNHRYSLEDSRIKPAYGFHPEQDIPSDDEVTKLLDWMEGHVDEMVAVGEVGLPYYKRLESDSPFDYGPYVQLLDQFMAFAAKWNKPIVLHAVYEDALIACDLLEKHDIKNAHFHWFKGDDSVTRRMMEKGYFISITPDVLYEKEIQQLVRLYPITQIMIETDGPWPFEGPFEGQMTAPKMMKHSIKKIAQLKDLTFEKTERILYENTKGFYRI
ncbi:DNAase [Ureibacillus massiliensis 4400831 = CIP 108448 = CCUG 49529]|uniref:DNAase n=1 Tax=Ureibacillus massiliensis 4400831 = CIP 108448 = CCUG 49529 TaxID=1211035 RepID=A0A0A3J5M2_9BACL|nr:TatD family hydrolase [Ureibacillus massiliensis]KGR92309.1 DNAase [Ureibacillus massiliensis 4400831 = CIP 108448 = CCUG 49529]